MELTPSQHMHIQPRAHTPPVSNVKYIKAKRILSAYMLMLITDECFKFLNDGII